MTTIRTRPRVHTALEIWVSSVEALKKMQAEEPDVDIKEYYDVLIEFRQTFTANNPFSNPLLTKEVAMPWLQKLSALDKSPSLNDEMKAAVFNLKGLIMIRSDIDPVGHYSKPHIFVMSPILKAIFAVDKAKTLQAAKQFIKAAAEFTIAENILELLRKNNFAGLSEDEYLKAAGIYSAIAYQYRKANDRENSEKFYDYAISLAPNMNVINNNAAIALSKINNIESLSKAADILAKFYDSAVKNNLFVTPFYHGDVHLKLAYAYRESYPEKFIFHQNIAAESIKGAEIVLENNTTYDKNYKNKAFARLFLLKANFDMLNENTLLAKVNQDKAAQCREGVDEPEEKKKKFSAKFIDFDKLASGKRAGMFFRSDEKKVEVEKKDELVTAMSSATLGSSCG